MTFAELAEEIEEANVVVKNDKDEEVKTVAMKLAKGAKEATFKFETALKELPKEGVWTVDGKEYDFKVAAEDAKLVKEIKEAAAKGSAVLAGVLKDEKVADLVVEANMDEYANALKEFEIKTLDDVRVAMEKINEEAENAGEFEAFKKKYEAAKTNFAKFNVLKEQFGDIVKAENNEIDNEGYIAKLNGLTNLKSLEEVEEVIKTANASLAVDALFKDGEEATEKLAEGVDQAKIDAAKALVDELDEGIDKEGLAGKVEKAQKALDTKEEEAKKLAERIEETKANAEKAMKEYETAKGEAIDETDTKYKKVAENLKALEEAKDDDAKEKALKELNDENGDGSIKALEDATAKLTAVGSFTMELVEEKTEVKAGEPVKIKITALKAEDETDAVNTDISNKDESGSGGEETAKTQTRYNETISQIVVKLGESGETTTAENVKFTKGEAIIEVVFTKVTGDGDKSITIEKIDGKDVKAKPEAKLKLNVVAGELDKVTAEYSGTDGIKVKATDKYKNAVDFEIKEGKLVVKEGDKASISGKGVANNGSVIVSEVTEKNGITVTLTEGKYTLTLNNGEYEFEIEVEAEKEAAEE